MNIARKTPVLIVSFLFLFTILPSDLYSAWWHKKKKTPAKHQVKKKARQVKKKVRNYKEQHDINNDGTVNARDRLLWLRNKRGNYQKAFVSTENEDMVIHIKTQYPEAWGTYFETSLPKQGFRKVGAADTPDDDGEFKVELGADDCKVTIANVDWFESTVAAVDVWFG